MNLSTELKTETCKIEAYRVSHDLMREFSADYGGGFWHFFELSNGGFYITPTLGTLRVCIRSNGFEGRMTGDAAGVTVCLFSERAAR